MSVYGTSFLNIAKFYATLTKPPPTTTQFDPPDRDPNFLACSENSRKRVVAGFINHLASAAGAAGILRGAAGWVDWL